MTVLISEKVEAWTDVAKVLDEGLSAGLYPGASVLVGDKSKTLFRYSVGDSDVRRIYDVASLTKVIVTTTLVMHLEEQGKLALTDRVSNYIPAFSQGPKEKVTVEDLLRHRAGLPSGSRPLTGELFDQYIERIASAPLSYAPHSKTIYSDLSFIFLGRIVELVSGKAIAELANEVIFAPLKMKSSAFQVGEENISRCAPTAQARRCEVHDPTAFHLLPHRVGNAGLFSTLEDLSKFVRMILNSGKADGVPVLSQLSIKKMLDKEGPRGLGWDFESEFSDSPRGHVFPKGVSFGHTGYTGTAIWIDPQTDSFYILLSNRVFSGDERTKKPFSALRKKLSTEIGKKIYSPASPATSRQGS